MSTQELYKYLKSSEVQFLSAAVARIIPADDLGPGALEAGVVYFIDQQLQTSWGVHGRQYRLGPWHEGTPEQGYQSKLTPQEIYRIGIFEINQYCYSQFGKNFSQMKFDQQDEILSSLENNQIVLPSLSAQLFFNILLRNTIEGFFADPLYGGNRDKIGWQLIGFPGVAASNYVDLLQEDNLVYKVEPVSILDIQEQKIKIDAQGYPVHKLRESKLK